MKTLTDKKQVNKVTKDQIIDYLDKKFWEEKQYECMPENEYGYEYVPREALGRIVDGLIPMVKNMGKQKNNSSPEPDQTTEEEIKRILMNNFTRGDIKRATEQLVDLLKSEIEYKNKQKP